MQKKSGDFSMQDVIKLANSPQGQQLLQALRQADEATVNTAAMQAGKGDLEQAKKTLAALLSSPQIRQMLEKLGG